MTKRTRISSGGPWEDRVCYSRAVRTGEHVYVSGTTATQPNGTTPDGADAQTRATLNTIEGSLTDADTTIEDVVRVRNYVTNIEEWEQIAVALRKRFAMTMVRVTRLIGPSN
jgi:enamine deaminase RidA (YjgF/YER057c/UK114 family)